jgi:hypothetical protein
MTSSAYLIKSNKTRQGDILQMHRRGDAVAKQVKKINKTKKKRRKKKKDSAAPARKSAQPMNPATASTAHLSHRIPLLHPAPTSRRRSAGLEAARRRWCREPCAEAGGGRGAAACGWWSREERGGAVGSISPPFFPSLTHSCCFLARRPGLF